MGKIQSLLQITMRKTKEYLHSLLMDIVYKLTEEYNWKWLDVLIDVLCNLEVNIRLMRNRDLYDNLRFGDVGTSTCASWNQTQIPQDSLYCQGCPFHTISEIATLFYGDQMSGYCYYLNQGDFSFGHSTNLLWDGCKECGINEDEL